MNKIVLITTEGCVGCDIMKRSIKSAIEQTKVDITVEELDIKKVNYKFIRQFKVNDVPCVLFFKDNNYLFKKIGSVPAVVVVQWINVHFK